MRAIPDSAVDFVSQWEGCRLSAYRDIVGVLTVGFGHTGPDVTPTLKIGVEEARKLLKQDLQTAEARIRAQINGVTDELSDEQFTSLLSFVFNLGANASWSIWKVLKARQFDAVPAQLLRFVNAGGKPVKGLVRRRAAEAELWHDDAHAVVLPSSATRSMDTPPTPTETKPLSQSKSFMTTALTAATTASVAIGEVSKQVSPFADKSPLVAHAVMILATLGAVAAVAATFFVWWKRRAA